MYLLSFGLILFGCGIAETVSVIYKIPLDSGIMVRVCSNIIGSIPMVIGANIISYVLTKKEDK
jgi:hypothetical protein